MKTVISLATAILLSLAASSFSAESVEEGFTRIFNGEDLTGWTEVAGWAVEDGMLRTAGSGSNIYTLKEYESFELRFDFVMSPGGNSGVFFRRGGLEVQLLDDYSEQYKNLKEWQYCGSLYAYVPPSERVTKPAGELQTMTIRLEGQKLTVELNGTQIVEADFDKLQGHAGFAPGAGRIGLQNYGGVGIAFRNIRIKEL